MIILPEVASKLERILNNEDDFTNPLAYYFQVETEGFHIDHIKKADQSGNFIPVFISSLGGQFNPVKGLKQATYSIPVVIYYPVRFKDDFFTLGEFLEDVFVGAKINWGTISGSAISNISVPQYGEIQNLDFTQFKQWVNDNYQKSIEKMEPYMTMQFTLYLSSAASGLLYGNDVNITFSFEYNGLKLTIDNVHFDGASIQSNSQTQSEQEEETNEANSVPFGTAYGSSFKIYPNIESKANEWRYVSGYLGPNTYYIKRTNEDTYFYVSIGEITSQQAYNVKLMLWGVTELYTRQPYLFYKELLKVWLQGNIQTVDCEITFKIANDDELVYTRKCFIQSVVAPIEVGQLLSLTLTFAKKSELEEEGD